MMKENGRLKPKQNYEVSQYKNKAFVCPKCNREYKISNPEFGVNYYCEHCNSTILVENK